MCCEDWCLQTDQELKVRLVKYIIAISGILLCMSSACSGRAQDTTFVSVNRGKVADTIYHSPRKAALFSAVFPGLGQVYNRKYWKLPLVYAGFTSLGYFVYFNGTHYITYRNAYLDFTDKNPGTTSYLKLISPSIDPSTYDDVLYPETYKRGDRDWVESQLKNGMDYYKRYRDMSMIGLAGWYILTILDAVVDAQLFDFDISPDLSMQVLPAVRPDGTGTAAGLTCSFTF
ncbi:MAG TPA: hypothetical protein ENK25_08975 [Bacteroidetes bacterium]|nr:hypothetical protein [Bacteroidota bacterium]